MTNKPIPLKSALTTGPVSVILTVIVSLKAINIEIVEINNRNKMFFDNFITKVEPSKIVNDAKK